MDQFNGAEAAVRMLQLNGVRHIFGLCGDTSLPFYDALYRMEHGMTHVLTRDERSAAYMADGYARVSGKVGVCEGPSGGGATYLLPGLVEANESSMPVLGITSDVPVLSRGRYPAHRARPGRALPAAHQVEHGVRSRGTDSAGAFAARSAQMTTGRPGAAHIGLPYDVHEAAGRCRRPLGAAAVTTAIPRGAMRPTRRRSQRRRKRSCKRAAPCSSAAAASSSRRDGGARGAWRRCSMRPCARR